MCWPCLAVFSTEVHDLHIWSLSVGKPSLSVHLLVGEQAKGVLENAHALLVREFKIHHSTIQVRAYLFKFGGGCGL